MKNNTRQLRKSLCGEDLLNRFNRPSRNEAATCCVLRGSTSIRNGTGNLERNKIQEFGQTLKKRVWLSWPHFFLFTGSPKNICFDAFSWQWLICNWKSWKNKQAGIQDSSQRGHFQRVWCQIAIPPPKPHCNLAFVGIPEFFCEMPLTGKLLDLSADEWILNAGASRFIRTCLNLN